VTYIESEGTRAMTSSHWTRRDLLTRAAALGAVAVGGPTALAACSSTSTAGNALTKAQQSGTIKVGIAGEAPYGYVDKSGNLTGEAPTVARAVFKNLGIKNMTATTVDFDSLIPALNAGQFDMAAAGQDITPTRCKSVAFSEPDYQALVAFLVPKGNPKGVNTFTDVIAKKVPIGVEIGAVEAGFATTAGVPSSQTQTFSSQDQLFSAVKTGRVYAAVLTDISWRAVVAQNPTAGVEMATPFIPKGGLPETGGFTFRKNETQLLSAFNTQLSKLHSSGQWTKLVQPFFFTSANIPPSSVTTAKLCAG
jgi:polar amino acid transport system substrate-binding protein